MTTFLGISALIAGAICTLWIGLMIIDKVLFRAPFDQ